MIGHPNTIIGNIKIDPDKIAIGTICSVTINGIFLKKGIYTTSQFGGVLEYTNGKPYRFIEIIKHADYISTTTELLAKSIIPLNKKVFIFPNTLSVLDSYIYPVEIKNDKLRFGYIGSSYHLPDIEMLRGVKDAGKIRAKRH